MKPAIMLACYGIRLRYAIKMVGATILPHNISPKMNVVDWTPSLYSPDGLRPNLSTGKRIKPTNYVHTRIGIQRMRRYISMNQRQNALNHSTEPYRNWPSLYSLYHAWHRTAYTIQRTETLFFLLFYFVLCSFLLLLLLPIVHSNAN